MKTLLLIRHAKSDWTFPGLADIDRPLNERGYRDTTLVVDELIKTKYFPDLIVTSPAVRAATTAMIMARKLEYDLATIRLEKRLYDTTPKEYLRILNSTPKKFATVAFFAHNPTISLFASLLSSEEYIDLPTCSVLVLRSGTEDWSHVSGGTMEIIQRIFPKNLRPT